MQLPRKLGACGRLSLALAPARRSPAPGRLPQGQGLVIETLFGWVGAGAPYGGAAAPRENKIERADLFRIRPVGPPDLVRRGLGRALRAVAAGAQTLSSASTIPAAGCGRGVWSNDAWVFSLEASAYASGARDAARPAQAGDTGPEARGRARSSATILRCSARRPFSTREAGYRLRTQGPPERIPRRSRRWASPWTPRAQVLAQSFNTVSNGAGAPGFSAWESHIGPA